MKKVLSRLIVLLVLLAATLWTSNTPKVLAFDCVNVGTMFDAMAACDNAYSVGVEPFHDLINNNPSQCSYTADNEAIVQCGTDFNDPNVTACYESVYTQTYNGCATAVGNSYQQAGDTYNSCLWNALNPGCFETLEFCPLARDRANQCGVFAADDGYSACISASGVDHCQ